MDIFIQPVQNTESMVWLVYEPKRRLDQGCVHHVPISQTSTGIVMSRDVVFVAADRTSADFVYIESGIRGVILRGDRLQTEVEIT